MVGDGTPAHTLSGPASLGTGAGTGLSGRSAPAPAPGSSLSRRTVLGAGVGALVLAGCVDDEPIGRQTPAGEAPAAELREYADTYGDTVVWEVGFNLEDGQEAPETYSADAQAARHEALEAKKAERAWTAQDPLLVLDPYGTTCAGLYVHFTDPAAGALDYTVRASNTADYAASAANHADAGVGFDGLVIGLVPGAHNDLTLSWTPEGNQPVVQSLQVKAPPPASGYGTQLSARIEDPDALAPGLFALSGVSGASNNTYLFDGNGVMRAEFLSTDHPSHNFVAEQGRLVITTGARQVSVIDPLGHATAIIDLGDHMIHHDVEVVGDVAYVLTSKIGSGRLEDRVVRVDLGSGEVAQCVDLQPLLPEYEAIAYAREGADSKDWIHINTVHVADGVMYLSGRETSTILALDNALEADSEPSVRWLIGAEELFAPTSHVEHFLAPEGSPTGIAGQHTVYRIDDDSLPEGQYYLEMFNNNYWFLGTRDPEDWEDAGPDTASMDELEGTSHVLRYLVDENTGTYREDFRIDVPYSTVVSGVQRLGAGTLEDAMVVNSGKANEFSERRADGTVVASYRYDSSNYGYRVYKDAFEGFWFAAT